MGDRSVNERRRESKPEQRLSSHSEGSCLSHPSAGIGEESTTQSNALFEPSKKDLP